MAALVAARDGGSLELVAQFVDYYKMLAVHRYASPEVIDAAYRVLVRHHHPDLNPGDHAAGERTKQINEAYAVLSDPERRRIYNRQWDAQRRPSRRQPRRRRRRQQRRRSRQTPQ